MGRLLTVAALVLRHEKSKRYVESAQDRKESGYQSAHIVW